MGFGSPKYTVFQKVTIIPYGYYVPPGISHRIRPGNGRTRLWIMNLPGSQISTLVYSVFTVEWKGGNNMLYDATL